jgi:hypothetical protein
MLCQWYIAQTGESEEEFLDELAGRLLEMVVSHEVGHVLGLTHNFYVCYNNRFATLACRIFTLVGTGGPAPWRWPFPDR